MDTISVNEFLSSLSFYDRIFGFLGTGMSFFLAVQTQDLAHIGAFLSGLATAAFFAVKLYFLIKEKQKK